MLDYLSNIDNPAAIGYYERRENPFHVRLELQEDIMKKSYKLLSFALSLLMLFSVVSSIICDGIVFIIMSYSFI